jgi:hypothetical protein
VKRKVYHKTFKQQTPHITSLLLKRALKVGQLQRVPKHVQQVEEGLEARSVNLKRFQNIFNKLQSLD